MIQNISIILYVDVILPLSLPQLYTYQIPDSFSKKVKTGKRVVVQFGKKKLYTGIVYKVHNNPPSGSKIKPILSLEDKKPIVTKYQLKLWEWIASYYMASLGEVMNASVPAGFKLSSETSILLDSSFNNDTSKLGDKEFLVCEALIIQNELTIHDIQSILDQKMIYPVINSLLKKKIIRIKETLKEKFKPKIQSYIRFTKKYKTKKEQQKALAILERAPRQQELLMALIDLLPKMDDVEKKSLLKAGKGSIAQIKELEQKKIIEIYTKEISRLDDKPFKKAPIKKLTPIQETALQKIKESFKNKHVTLLHGVTSSGKTEIYIKLIQEIINQGKQVLYLLPEIGLTTQIIHRLRAVFGNKIGIYHSKFNNNERVETYLKLLKKEYQVILGARSAIFLPFTKLGLVIIDEEHDTSYKQFDPAPRYQGRDSGIYLASLFKAKTLLGSATPSLESYYNTKINKFELVELSARYGNIKLPEIIIEDITIARKKRELYVHFTNKLIKKVQQTFEQKKQSILFQNRRGFAPYLMCNECKWIPRCNQCDVSLSYYKERNILKCHYCGYISPPINSCSNCNSKRMQFQGFGTEKVAEELQLLIPEIKISRMDLDSARTKAAYNNIIGSFERKEIDVLVGTQMVTKGLDFENVSFVGILNADQLLHYPDFRANERAFQLMEQVSGRAGRKNKRGLVIIQTNKPDDATIHFVINHDYKNFYRNETHQRKFFLYPPYSRLIKITVKHKKEHFAQQAAIKLCSLLNQSSIKNILGPASPPVSRIRGYYLRDILIKMGKSAKLIAQNKYELANSISLLSKEKEYKSAIFSIDVDPM